jgi:hypothetical protein
MWNICTPIAAWRFSMRYRSTISSAPRFATLARGASRPAAQLLLGDTGGETGATHPTIVVSARAVDANALELVLFNRISLIPQTSTTRLPLGGIGGSLVVESRKNGHFFSWNYLVGLFGGINRVLPPARPPARGRPTPRAAPRPRQRPPRAAHRGAPFAARSLCFVAAGQRTENG